MNRIIEPPQKTPFNQLRGDEPFDRAGEIFNRTWWLFWNDLMRAVNLLLDAFDDGANGNGVTQDDLPVEY